MWSHDKARRPKPEGHAYSSNLGGKEGGGGIVGRSSSFVVLTIA